MDAPQGARVVADAGVDPIKIQVDDQIARVMKRNGVTLVSTLSVLASWETFARTTTIDRFTTEESRARIAMRKVEPHGDPLSDLRAMWRVWSVYQAGVRVA